MMAIYRGRIKMREREMIIMEFHLQSSSLYLLFFVLPLLFLLRIFIKSYPKHPYPPGPTGLPLIGNWSMRNQITHRRLTELGKQYGGIVHLRIGTKHTISITSPEMAREVLQVQDNICADRTTTMAMKYLSYDLADMGFANQGPFWREAHKLCVMKLLSRRREESRIAIRDEVNSMIRLISAKSGSPINFTKMGHTLNSNIIYRAAFGSELKESQDEFISIMGEFSKLFVAFNMVDFIPWLSWVDPQGLKPKLAAARKSLDRFIDKIIDDRMMMRKKKKMNVKSAGSDHDGHADTNMIDQLLEFYNEDEPKRVVELEDLTNGTIRLNRDNIKGIIMNVMFGGTKTIAAAIDWTMAELLRNPEDLKRVQQELTEVVGLKTLNRARIQNSDMKKLTYLKCVLKETLRLHPSITLLPHENSVPTQISGYSIPKGSQILVNTWAVDKAVWDDAETFKPSRFLKELTDEVPTDLKGNNKNFGYIPFGVGRRSCPALQLNHYLLEFGLSNLLHCFSWELPNGMSPSDLDMNDGTGFSVTRDIPLVAVPRPRLQCPLF